jgi:starch synthase
MKPAITHNVTVITHTGEQLDRLLPDWLVLAAAHGRSFYARPWYSLSWWSYVRRGELALFVVYRGDRLVALAPLHRRRLLGQYVLRLLGHGLGTVGEILTADDDAAAALWDAIADYRATLQLTHVRPDDAAILALRRHPQWQQHIEVNDRCLVTLLRETSTARSLRSARTVRQFRRYHAALDRAGAPFAVELLTDLDGLRRRWPEMVRVAALADANHERQNLLDERWAPFSPAFLGREVNNGTMLVFGATAGGRWVAHDIDFRCGGTLTQWFSLFDPSLSAQSLGHLILEWVIDHHTELGIDTIDASVGENDFKLSWSNAGYDVASVTGSSAGLLSARARLGLAGALGGTARALSR